MNNVDFEWWRSQESIWKYYIRIKSLDDYASFPFFDAGYLAIEDMCKSRDISYTRHDGTGMIINVVDISFFIPHFRIITEALYCDEPWRGRYHMVTRTSG